ncbi:hypothetical protein [Hyalangium minutum]|nr:hypothetical protein [Hyalangium minutum]
MWTPKSSSPPAPAEPSRRTELLFPWKEEPPAPPRRPSRQLPPEDLDTLLNRSWPPLAKEAEPEQSAVPSRTAEPLEEHRGGPWPELLESPPADSAEALTALRQWERLSLHEREPRGE